MKKRTDEHSQPREYNRQSGTQSTRPGTMAEDPKQRGGPARSGSGSTGSRDTDRGAPGEIRRSGNRPDVDPRQPTGDTDRELARKPAGTSSKTNGGRSGQTGQTERNTAGGSGYGKTDGGARTETTRPRSGEGAAGTTSSGRATETKGTNPNKAHKNEDR